MKRIFITMLLFWIAFSTVLSINNTLPLSLPSGTAVQLSCDLVKNPQRLMSGLLEKCEEYKLNLYKSEYMGERHGKDLFKVYYTDTTPNNLISHFEIINGGKTENGVLSTVFSPNKPYVKSFNLQIDYDFFPFSDLTSNSELSGIYVILTSDQNQIEPFLKALNELGFGTKILPEGTIAFVGVDWKIQLFFAVVFLLLLLYIMIQNQKSISIKKLSGYNNRNLIWESILGLIKNYIGCLLPVIALVFGYLMFLHEYDSTLDFFLQYLKLQGVSFLALLLLHSISNLYLLKIRPVSRIKNFTKDIVIDLLSMAVKIGVFFMIVLYAMTSFSSLQNLQKAASSIDNWEKTQGYSYTITQGYFPDTKEDSVLFEQKFGNLYRFLYEQKEVILLDAGSVQTMTSQYQRADEPNWSYDFGKVVVNRNYFKLNPLPESCRTRIDAVDKDKTILLIPKHFQKDEKEIIDHYIQNLPLKNPGKDAVVPIIYEGELSIFTADLMVETKGNTVKNPIIVVDDYNFEGGYYMSSFSMGRILIPVTDKTNPYAELSAVIEKAGLKNTIKVTPPVFSRYSETVKEYNTEVSKVLAQLVILIVIAVTIIYNAIAIFLSKNSEEISVKKTLGYGLFSIYGSCLRDTAFTWLVVAALLFLFQKNVSFVPVLGVFSIIELLITYIFIRFQEHKNIISIIKGNV